MPKGQARAALPHYREVIRIRPEFGRAHLGLGSALAAVGDVSEAIPHLEKAAGDSDSAVHGEAIHMLRQLGKER
jgi:Flp pilus assembly protein TadD